MSKLNNAAGDGYRGPAPEPARKLDLSDGTVTEKEQIFLPDGSAMDVPEPGPQVPLTEYAAQYDAASPTVPLPDTLQRQPEPAALPAAAAVAAPTNEVQELRESVAQLQKQLESQGVNDRQRSLETERMRLQMAAVTAAGASPAPAAGGADLFQGMDDDDTLTVGQGRAFAAQLGQLVPAVAKQAVWDITQEEINAVFAETPALQNTQEPQRTDLIQRLVQNRREQLGRNGSQQPVAEAVGKKSDVRTTRPVEGRVVPHVEGQRTPTSATEPRAAEDVMAVARRKYAEVRADRSLSRRERQRQSRYWRDQVLIAQGVQPGSEFDYKFEEHGEAPRS
jgi:hypothetical protein